MSSHDAYTALAAEFAEASLLSSTAALLSWDEQCGMPHAGGSARADQCALLAKLVHAKTTSPRVGELLNELQSGADLDADQQANVRQLQRGYDKHAKLPAALVSALAKQEVLSQQAWVEARKADDFAAFSPWLETMLKLKREVADAYALGGTRYDALLDDFEPHASAAEITSVFQQLREPLVKLVQQVLDSPRKSALAAIEVDAPIEAQKQFGRMAAKQLGFDFDAGRLDVSVHPFCSGIAPGDTRITTRFDDKFFPGSFFGVLHEPVTACTSKACPRRSCRPAALRGNLAGHPRKPEPHVGKPRRPQPRVLAILRAQSTRGVPRVEVCQRRNSPPRPQRHRPQPHSASRPTRRPTTCTFSYVSSSSTTSCRASSP